MVLLDIKLPRVDGLEVLERIKADPRTRHVPVVMLTSSREEQDLVRSYGLGVNAFVVKPVGHRDFFEAIPIEVEEAAMVDNVPSWRIFIGIVVPMSMNGLLATFMITLAFVWNEFLFALFLTNSRWQTLPILVAGQNSQRGDEWWAISAAALVAIVPMMIMAGLLSRMMRSGLLLGAIK